LSAMKKNILRPATWPLFLFSLLLPLIFGAHVLSAQDYVSRTFRGTRVINGHSLETVHTGELEFLISHRFGYINRGAYEFFGLDQASMRLGFEYGVNDRLMLGVGRSTYGKHYDAFAKFRLLRQRTDGKIPLSITLFTSAAINTLKPTDPNFPIYLQSRLAYTWQLLIGGKVNDRLSLQLMPTIVHYNLVETAEDHNDLLSAGAAIRFRFTKNVAILAEYYYVLPGQRTQELHDAFAIGFDINTGSHVFQLQITNATGMIEKAFIGETTGDWAKGDIRLGFNIARTFKLKGRRY